MLIFR
jgi:RNA-binding protein 25